MENKTVIKETYTLDEVKEMIAKVIEQCAHEELCGIYPENNDKVLAENFIKTGSIIGDLKSHIIFG